MLGMDNSKMARHTYLVGLRTETRYITVLVPLPNPQFRTFMFLHRAMMKKRRYHNLNFSAGFCPCLIYLSDE